MRIVKNAIKVEVLVALIVILIVSYGIVNAALIVPKVFTLILAMLTIACLVLLVARVVYQTINAQNALVALLCLRILAFDNVLREPTQMNYFRHVLSAMKPVLVVMDQHSTIVLNATMHWGTLLLTTLPVLYYRALKAFTQIY